MGEIGIGGEDGLKPGNIDIGESLGEVRRDRRGRRDRVAFCRHGVVEGKGIARDSRDARWV